MKEMTDWGMSVPGVINDHDSHDLKVDLPPVIGEVKSLQEHKAQKADASKYETKFPQNEDLDYPTMEELTKKDSSKDKAPSKLISIDSFNDQSLELEGAYVADESDISLIEAQIKDEVEENLWQADEFEDLKKEVAAKFEEAKNTFQPTRNDFDESLFKPLDSNDTVEWKEADELFNQDSTFSSFETPLSSPAASVDMDQVRSEMEQMVKKYVKEYMDELFQKNTEKVAWEVIPDLAENLIRQELSKISNKIINDG